MILIGSASRNSYAAKRKQYESARAQREWEYDVSTYERLKTLASYGPLHPYFEKRMKEIEAKYPSAKLSREKGG